ncbi:MAG: FLgD tudor-like domain-containing protein [Gammaproteobacteria bacterium]|jgi:flagellar basal-body rod modification protein FlgD
MAIALQLKTVARSAGQSIVNFGERIRRQQATQKMTVSLRSNKALQASTLVGRLVYVPSNNMVFTGHETVGVLLILEQESSDVVIYVENDNGDTILRKHLGAFLAGDIPLEFDPLDGDEVNLGHGRFFIRAEATVNESTRLIPVYVKAMVQSVELTNKGQEPVLNLQNTQSVQLSKVRIIL